MKAGILTLYKADNYGAVLQAYALQRTVVSLGAECELISMPFGSEPEKASGSLSPTAALLLKRIKDERSKRSKLFQDFRDNYLICSGLYEKDDIKQCADAYDILITGSDQVWNMDVRGADINYFLTFAPPFKRASYAASFGEEMPGESTQSICAEALKQYSMISVRESSAAVLIKQLTGRLAEVSVDPVFLPEKAFWNDLISRKNNDYYFLYMLRENASLISYAKSEANAAGIPLVTVTGCFVPEFGFNAFSRTGIPEWISLIANARGVFTDSYHGTAFSLIFNRPLFVSASNSIRIKELLELTDSAKSFDRLYSLDPGSFGEAIRKPRASSIRYLKEILNYAG